VIRPGLAVLCAGESFEPVPGRVAASSDQPGRWWVVVCLDGWHQPQVYDEAMLSVVEVSRSGLCAECATARPALPAGSVPFALTAKVGV
jgi:hypothetical protein